MVVADALVPNMRQGISNYHAVNTDSFEDFIWNVSVKIADILCFGLTVLDHYLGVNFSLSLWNLNVCGAFLHVFFISWNDFATAIEKR